AAGQINERDNPARARELLQHDAVNHQRRGQPERNNVCQRIELAPERTLMPTQPRQASIEKIKNESAKYKPDCSMKKIRCRIWIGSLEQSALQNFERRREPAKQISRRHEIRQQVNLRRVFVHERGKRATIVEPPKTWSPTFTRSSALSGKYNSVREPKRIIPNRSPFFNSSPIFAHATMRLAIAPVIWRTTIVTRGFSKAHVMDSFFSEHSGRRASKKSPGRC